MDSGLEINEVAPLIPVNEHTWVRRSRGQPRGNSDVHDQHAYVRVTTPLKIPTLQVRSANFSGMVSCSASKRVAI